MSVGVVSAFTVLLSPTLLPAEGVDIVLAGVLPLSFFAAGAVAQLLRPHHVVGLRLLQVGLLHLGAIAGAVLGSLLDDVSWVAAAIGMASGLAFGLGFVALLDLLVRYPDGYYAWPWVRSGVRVLAVATLPLVVIAGLGSSRVISVVELSGPANPAYLPALRPLSGLVVAVAMTPVVGFILLVARYRRAPASDRMQMRWPMITALVIAVGLVSSGLAERTLGEDVQTAVFVVAAAALPASFLIGLLRHSEEAERLVAVEASRARIAEAASEERRRIERDLHDGAQQQLVALLARIELARSKVADADPRVDQELGEISDADRAGASGPARTRPRDTPGDSHRPRVGRGGPLCDEQAARGGLARCLVRRGRREIHKQPRGGGVPLRARRPHQRAEALRRHHPAVQLTQVDDDLVITISDTGRGVPVDETGKSGLTGLRDRLAAVGGRLEVESSAGLGTRLRGTFPASTRVTR